MLWETWLSDCGLATTETSNVQLAPGGFRCYATVTPSGTGLCRRMHMTRQLLFSYLHGHFWRHVNDFSRQSWYNPVWTSCLINTNIWKSREKYRYMPAYWSLFSSKFYPRGNVPTCSEPQILLVQLPIGFFGFIYISPDSQHTLNPCIKLHYWGAIGGYIVIWSCRRALILYISWTSINTKQIST